jgi:hypothetical protein
VAELDGAVPVARGVVQTGQIVDHLRIVRPQRQRLLERIARARWILERPGVDVGQLAQDVEAVDLVDAELGHLAQHLGELGGPVGAAQEHGEPDARAEVVGARRAARRNSSSAPLAAAHQLDRRGRAEVDAGGARLAFSRSRRTVGQLAALTGGAHQADQVVVAQLTAVRRHGGLPQARPA